MTYLGSGRQRTEVNRRAQNGILCMQAAKLGMRHTIVIQPSAGSRSPAFASLPASPNRPYHPIKSSSLYSFESSAPLVPSETRVSADLFSSLLPAGWTDEPPEPNIWDWLSAARRAAFSIRSWSTSARHSSHRRFASSAEASAASSS